MAPGLLLGLHSCFFMLDLRVGGELLMLVRPQLWTKATFKFSCLMAVLPEA